MTTRAGGVSTGAHASLNLGAHCGDDPAAVAANRERLQRALGLAGPPQWLRQVHGTRVLRAPFAQDDTQADAAWTDVPGVAVVAQAADCLPVLLCDRAGTVVAAAHAGWRGLAAGVLEATVAALPVPPASLLAWLGAAISQAAFEVGDEVRETYVREDAATAAAFRAGAAAGKWHADLYALARRRLVRAGVTAVSGGDRCTWSEPAHFFSHRRDPRGGRQAALAWLAP